MRATELAERIEALVSRPIGRLAPVLVVDEARNLDPTHEVVDVRLEGSGIVLVARRLP